jgi:hypothetical protein
MYADVWQQSSRGRFDVLFDFFVIPEPGRIAGTPSRDAGARPFSQELSA